MKHQEQDKHLNCQLLHTTEETKTVKNLKWIGTALFVLASTSMALFGHKYISMQLYIFICYVFGALCWLSVAIMTRDRPQMVLYSVFAAVDITGITMRLFI